MSTARQEALVTVQEAREVVVVLDWKLAELKYEVSHPPRFRDRQGAVL
jgi:hypothetical protein